MNINRRMRISIAYIILGLILLGFSVAEYLDEFYAGMGGALIAIGAIRLYQYVRYKKDADYRETKTIELHDERNAYIRNKAWAWTGYLLVFVGAVCTIAFKLIGKEELMMFASSIVCFVLVLYWFIYLYLQKKY